MRAARFMKWGAPLIMQGMVLVSIMVGATTAWYFGLLTFLMSCGALYLLGYGLARCPHCGQVWWAGAFLYAAWRPGSRDYRPQENETESFVCRRCRIDIGFALRD
jgi:hypothetical protein